MPTITNYLDPQTLASVGSLQLRARLVVEGLMAGMHRSPYHGVSVEFAQHRQYTPGDDIRRLDWKVFGRSDKLYLKQYQKETNLDLVLLVDASGSMAYGSDEVAGNRWRKFDCASTLASVLAYLAVNQQDRAGLMLFDDALRGTIRPTNARRQSRAIVDALAQHELALGDNELTEAQARGSRAALFTGRGTDLGRLFDQIGARLTHRSLIVLISDVFDAVESFERGLARLSHRRHDVVVVQMMDHAEIMFPFRSSAEFVGMEGEGRLRLDPAALRAAYMRTMREHLGRVEDITTRFKYDYMLVDTSAPLGAPLSRLLLKRAAANEAATRR